jgi:hypothetical protein
MSSQNIAALTLASDLRDLLLHSAEARAVRDDLEWRPCRCSQQSPYTGWPQLRRPTLNPNRPRTAVQDI